MSETILPVILTLLQVLTLAVITVLQRQNNTSIKDKLAPLSGDLLTQNVKTTVQETQSPLLSILIESVETNKSSVLAIQGLATSFESARQSYEGSDQFLKDTLNKLRTDFSALKEQTECDREQIATLKAEVANLKEQVIKIEAREKRMEQERDNAMIELAKVQAQLDDTKQQLVLANSKIEALTAQHEADLIRLGQKQAQIDALQKPAPDPLAAPASSATQGPTKSNAAPVPPEPETPT